MSEMVDRVARALCRQYEIDDGFSPDQFDRAAASDMYRNFRAAAHAAIEAMREPTDEMLQVGGEVTAADGYFDYKETSGQSWRAMIDEALK